LSFRSGRLALKAYRKRAALGCTVWMKHGALDYYECVGEDLHSPMVAGASR
jgi:uncharacterized protein YbaA (DUF1428 family)